MGKDTMEAIAQKRVIIFGVGGVGSWCAESLVRSGIQHLTIVDFDCVDVTNVNRQLMATTQTVGQVKVDALKERLLSINPSAEITARREVFSAETAGQFALDSYDYIIDAIDSLKDKALLILMATSLPSLGVEKLRVGELSSGIKRGPRFFSSMGAALKTDPTRIKVSEFWKIQGDPLARALRKRFKHDGRYPESKFQCVYSDELVEARDTGKGSIVHITAIFGFMLAGLVIQDIVNKKV